MALFIEVRVDPQAARDPALAQQLVEACPVDIFQIARAGSLEIVEANVDECTLCELCLMVGRPGQVSVLKLYDEGRPLERS